MHYSRAMTKVYTPLVLVTASMLSADNIGAKSVESRAFMIAEGNII